MIRRSLLVAATCLALSFLGLAGCTNGDSATSGGNTSGGTSGGATQVGPSAPNGAIIYTHIEGAPCVPSRGGKVTISGSNATAGDIFDVAVYHPYGSNRSLEAGSRPSFPASVRVGQDGRFSWSFTCGRDGDRYPTGTYGVEFAYGGTVVKTEAFDVSEPPKG